MKNDTRNRIYIRYASAALRGGVFVCFGAQVGLVPLVAFAEVGLPPPAAHQNSGFPSEQALRQKGYDPKTGVWRVQSQNNGKPTVTNSGGTITGSQSKTVTVTGNYGEKGTIRTTQTQKVSSSKLQNAVNGVWLGGALANAVDRHSGLIGARIRSGDYKGAVQGSFLMFGTFGNNLFGGIPESLGNLGRGLGLIDSPSPQDFRQAGERFYQWQMQQEKGGDLGGAIAAAAAKKAAEGAAAAKKAEEKAQAAKEQAKQGKTIWQLTKFTTTKTGSFEESLGKYTDKNPSYTRSRAEYDGTGKNDGVFFELGDFEGYLPQRAPKGVVAITIAYKSVSYDEIGRQDPEMILKNMTLNQQEIKDILSRMLNNQQTNHEELMRQLSRIGDAVEKSTESNQFTPMTADSAPYTPQGSNTPQQTRFTLNPDGSISTTVIPRPDLKPNSTLAPTRSEIIPNPNKGQDNPAPTSPNSPDTPNTPNSPNTPNQPGSPTGQQNQNQNQEQQDFCRQNPNAAQCMTGEDFGYEDLQIPENSIDLELKPLNIFSNDGICPANPVFNLGALGTFEIPYDYFCSIARLIRPILILATILFCGFFAYNAVKEL